MEGDGSLDETLEPSEGLNHHDLQLYPVYDWNYNLLCGLNYADNSGCYLSLATLNNNVQWSNSSDHFEDLQSNGSSQIYQWTECTVQSQLDSSNDLTAAIANPPALSTRPSLDVTQLGDTPIIHKPPNLRPILPKRAADPCIQDLPPQKKKRLVTFALIYFIISRAHRQNSCRQIRGR